MPIVLIFRHLLAKQTELVNWLFTNHPFLPKKNKHEGKLLILELLLESISAFQFSQTHLVSDLGNFQVILLSLAQHAYCTSFSSCILPSLEANLLMVGGAIIKKLASFRHKTFLGKRHEWRWVAWQTNLANFPKIQRAPF